MKPAQTQFTEIDGIRTAELVLQGSGRAGAAPILMLHGWGASLKLMQPLGERLAALGWGVYIPDLPGFGESAPPPAAWDVPDYAKWVVTYLDAHQLEKVYLIGHSFGGRVGLVLGAGDPQAAATRPSPRTIARWRCMSRETLRPQFWFLLVPACAFLE